MSIIPPQGHLFDVPDDVAYFNCAYNSLQLNESLRRPGPFRKERLA